MKKTSRSGLSAAQLTTLVCVAFVLVLCILMRTFFGSLLWRVVAPVVVHTPFPTLAAYLHTKAALEAQNRYLVSALASTSALVADRSVLYEENLRLKASLGRDAGVRKVLAGVIMRPPGVPYDTLEIDAGLKQGVAVGQYVSAGGTTLIGRIDEVYATAARVVLFSAPGESHQALLSETPAHAAVPVIVEGQGSGSFVVEVPAHTQVAVGDAIVFPGIKDGLTAVVSHVDAKLGESFERIYVRMPVNPFALQFVEVLLQ